MKINRELLKGSTSMLILSLLKRQPMYGYEMVRNIEQKSEQVFSFKEGTLYPLLHLLESEGMIESYWDETGSQRKRKYYRITNQGERHFKEKQEEWATFRKAVERVLWEGISCT